MTHSPKEGKGILKTFVAGIGIVALAGYFLKTRKNKKHFLEIREEENIPESAEERIFKENTASEDTL